MWALLRRGALHTGYHVGAAEALRRLARHAPEAEQWWRQNTPYLYQGAHVLSFDEVACQVISGRDDPVWFIQFEAEPCPGNTEFPDAGLSHINCWVQAPSLKAALEIARADIRAWDWSVGEQKQAFPVEASTYTGTTDLLEPAQKEGAAYEFDCNAHDRRRFPPLHPQPGARNR